MLPLDLLLNKMPGSFFQNNNEGRATQQPLWWLTNLWPLDPRLNWNFKMFFFVEGGRPEYPEKNPQSKDENQQQTQLT